MVLGSMADGRETAKKAIEGFQEYCDTMFPFFEEAGKLDKQRDTQRLLDHVKYPMRIDVASIKAERAAKARAKASHKFRLRGAEIPGIMKRKP